MYVRVVIQCRLYVLAGAETKMVNCYLAKVALATTQN